MTASALLVLALPEIVERRLAPLFEKGTRTFSRKSTCPRPLPAAANAA